MKALRDLRPCDNCGGPVGLTFYIVRFSLALVSARAVNEFLGMHQFFGGQASSAVVENFAPHARQAVTVAGDREPSLMTELAICQECFVSRPLDMALLSERAAARSRREASADDEGGTA